MGNSKCSGVAFACWIWPMLLLVTFSLPCVARQDVSVPWSGLTLQTNVQGLPVTVTARVKGERLANLGVRVGTRTVHIPNTAFADIPSPQLHTLRVMADGYDESIWRSGKIPDAPVGRRPTFQITLEYGPAIEIGKDPYPANEIEFARVDFFVAAGEFRERWFRKPTGRGKWQTEFDCRPEWRPKGATPCSPNGPSL